MGTGWRRAFCTTIPRDPDENHHHPQSPTPSPRSCAKLGFLSNPSTPRLQPQPATSPSLSCQTAVQTSAGDSLVSPKLQCRTVAKSPRPRRASNPSSPRSPFSILKNSLRLSRNSCGVCLQSVKTGHGMAIFTAECSHAFHFPCIAGHVKKNAALVCPVCNSSWRDVPLLAIHKIQPQSPGSKSELESKKVGSNNVPKVMNQRGFSDNGKEEEAKHLPPPLPAAVSGRKAEERTYDDDEPLLSPTAGSGKFGPIPEVEEEEDEVEEFQGFFVNPISSSSDECAIGGGDSKNVEVSLIPEAAVVPAGRTHEAYAVVLRVKAPPTPAAQNKNPAQFLEPSRRAPIDLVTVLDVSGSMSGTKMQMLKRAMRLVISSLGSADRLSIVAFSACPKRLLPLRRMTAQGQRAARRIIDRLSCSQGTSVADALRKATKVLEDRRERNPVASIILLSDGQDDRVQSNNDNLRPGSAHSSSTRFAHIEIPVHSFGFGKKGGYSHEPAEDAFAKCVGGLLSVVVQDLRIELRFASGSDPAEISAVYSCNGRPTVHGPGTIRLGDLYAEEERELLVELRVPKPVVGPHHVLSVRCSYRDPANQETINGREQALLVPRPHAVRSSMPKIERLRNLFITTRAIAEARRLVAHNDLSSSHHLLASARALLMQSSSESTEEFVRGLEAELAELQWRRQYQMVQRRREAAVLTDENGEPLTPTSAWREAERLAKVAKMKKSMMNRVGDLHGFENARF
ncbi:E3 ubiquitin-protein ligase WAV3 [Diospyros lotus]|uniref:E3 ubiquitin-protein ligase WAV3 n=1 Tax=Diospyros lotus TaxID=55363 RepID=UPI00225271CE|nr:E3 ubiquitin-protein ligase WAV3 [Diospyros lotus]